MHFGVIQDELRRFADERDWNDFHTPRNLILAMMGEVGELAELFQWRSEAEGLPHRDALADELADVAIYLLRLFDICGIEPGEAIACKIQKNRVKYPIRRTPRSSLKSDR